MKSIEGVRQSGYRITLDKPVYKCETCHDTGLIDVPGTLEVVCAQCPACTERRKAERLQSICGLNADERRVRFEDVATSGKPGTARMIDAARAFSVSPSGILTLWGGTGNAKTAALQATVNDCMVRGVPAVYITFYDLAQWVRDSFDGKSESASVRVNRIASVRVLCIDEFDKVKNTEWTRELETAVIDKRYRDGIAGLCGTMLAMNSSPETLPDWIYSRLRDGRNKIIHNADGDMRPRMRQ